MPASVPKYTVPAKVRLVSRSLTAEFEKIVRDVGEFSVHVGDTMRQNPTEAARFIRQCVAATPLLFQKWNLEILYLLGLVPTMRFSQLKAMLTGISSRTLSLKLAYLEEQGLLDRTVQNERPLRVDYSLRDDGRTVARLSVPLVMYLNLRLGLTLAPSAGESEKN